jgi:hypothetical protein
VIHDHDERWKVIAARSARRLPYFSKTYEIRFAETEEEAESIQLAMLREWTPGGYATSRALGPLERRRRRLESRPSGIRL